MKTLALADGDLVVTPHGHATVSGSDKIKTELGLALSEPYGDDRFHPSWGSYLPSYIGQPMDQTTQMLVEAEVQRVLSNYIFIQRTEVTADSLASIRSRFSTADVITAVLSVQTTTVLDTIYVKIVLATQAGETIQITKVVNV